MVTCTNHGYGEFFKNEIDLNKHTTYRCGIDNPYHAENSKNDGKINRRTGAGSGIPNFQKTWNGVIRYGAITELRAFTKCDKIYGK